MNFNFFKIDTWWKAMLILGVIACVGAATIAIELIERKHLLGLGLGMIVIGFSSWIAWKTATSIAQDGFLSWKEIKHNFFTVFLMLIGIGLVGIFGFLIIKSLI